MRYARHDDILRPNWTTTTGTQRTGYTAANLGGQPDPSLPVWVTGTSIAVKTDLGTATPLAAVALINHTFAAALEVRLKGSASPTFSSMGLDEPFVIEAPYLNGFACHALIDLSAILAEGARTYRYWRVSNDVANDKTVAIGDIVLATEWRTLDPSIGITYQRPQTHLVNRQSSKRGVQTVYDMGSRERRLTGSTRVDTSELDTVLEWCDEQHQSARAMLIQLDENSASRRGREPHLCRFGNATRTPVSLAHDILYDVALEFEELGCGELVGA